MQSMVDEVKNLLTNSEVITRLIVESDYTPSEDPKYPTEFWKIKRFNYRINMDSLRKPSDNDWELIQSFQTKTLEEAIAHCILGTITNDVFLPCPLPENLQWCKHCFDIKESISSKIKWEERRINRNTFFILYDIFQDKVVESYSGSRWKINYLLAELPSTLTRVTEDLPYGFSTSNIIKQNPVEHYPWFMYNNKLYSSTQYIHDQKCICGKPLKEYNFREYDGSENDLKVEIWSVQKFFSRDCVYIYDTNTVFCNGIPGLVPIDDSSVYISNEIKKQMKLMYPEADRYDGKMESGKL